MTGFLLYVAVDLPAGQKLDQFDPNSSIDNEKLLHLTQILDGHQSDNIPKIQKISNRIMHIRNRVSILQLGYFFIKRPDNKAGNFFFLPLMYPKLICMEAEYDIALDIVGGHGEDSEWGDFLQGGVVRQLGDLKVFGSVLLGFGEQVGGYWGCVWGLHHYYML